MNKILEILGEIRPEYDFSEDVDFIEAGMLDSFDVISIVTELDEAFGISIDGADILPEYFSSLTGIRQLVEKNGGKLA